MGNWWYAKNGDRRGPLAEEELRKLVGSGEVGQADLVWTQGMAKWQAVKDIGLFQTEQRVEAAPSDIPVESPPPTPNIIDSVSPDLANDGEEAAPKKMRAGRSFLAWWAAIPLTAAIGFQILYGWVDAKTHATAPEFAMSYLTGRLLTTVAVSLLIAWAAYRLFRRSQLAGSIVFSLMMGLFCLSLFKQVKSQQMAGASGTTINSPIFGVSIGSPAGWFGLPPDKPRIIARWVSPDSTPTNIQGMILVESVKPTSADGGTIARDLAATWGGRVDSEQVNIDGERAWRIIVSSPSPTLQPVEGLVTIHEGHTFLIEGGTAAGRPCHEQIESIRRSWKWTAVDSPTQHLNFRDQPLRALDDRISLNFPAIMSVFEQQMPRPTLGLALYNLKRDGPDFDALVQLTELSPGDKFDDAAERLGKGMQERFKLTEAFAWHGIKNSRQAAITQFVRGPADAGVNWIMWAMVMLDERRFVLINFTLYAPDPSDQLKYADVAQRICESISSLQTR